jgi:hypothetical protein
MREARELFAKARHGFLPSSTHIWSERYVDLDFAVTGALGTRRATAKN